MKERILVLDDNQDILDIVQEVLTYENYEVLCIDSSRFFSKQVAEWKPDLIMLDFRLADGNGCELCRKLKNDPETEHIAVIIFSAYTSPKTDFSTCGCDAVINKPFDLSDLVEKIQNVLTANKV
jgi:DNA-binding response OmpR family regulator